MISDNVVMRAVQLNIARFIYYKTLLCIFGSRTFVPISSMCNKQTSVSHSCTESEVVIMDAGLQMYGTPDFDSEEVVIEVLHSSINRKSPTQEASGNKRIQGSSGKLLAHF